MHLAKHTATGIKLLAIECWGWGWGSKVVCADCSCSCGSRSGRCWKAPLREAIRWWCSLRKLFPAAKVRIRPPRRSAYFPLQRPREYGGDGDGDDDGGDDAFSSEISPRIGARCRIVSSYGDGDDGGGGDGDGSGGCSPCARRTRWWK